MVFTVLVIILILLLHLPSVLLVKIYVRSSFLISHILSNICFCNYFCVTYFPKKSASVISTQWFSLCPTLIISAKKGDKNLLN